MVTDHVITLTKSIANAVILIVVSVKDIQRYPAQAVSFWASYNREGKLDVLIILLSLLMGAMIHTNPSSNLFDVL